jgi:DNA-binding MarR family transcriptional regulator
MIQAANASLYHSSRLTPEKALAFAVVLQAIEDLGSQDEITRFEAHEFFLQPDGPWADMRRFYFSALDIDDGAAYEHLTARLDPPERPNKKWTFSEVYEILPPDRLFTPNEIADITPLHVSQMSGRITRLVKEGLVVRIAPGLFCRADSIDKVDQKPPPRPQMRRKTRSPEQKEEVALKAMRDGARTVREIGWELEMEYPEARMVIEALEAKKLIMRDADGYYRLVPQSVVVATCG